MEEQHMVPPQSTLVQQTIHSWEMRKEHVEMEEFGLVTLLNACVSTTNNASDHGFLFCTSSYLYGAKQICWQVIYESRYFQHF